ncbi:MAG TPA: HPr family phosphocarrier protein [Lachnospiraceae bacterium]|nr:HPr family phosphocarrier protein [Lachnospiraceae bacterium]
MLKQTMTIQLVNGFEARPVAVLVQLASQFDCSVYLETEGKRVNAKSIMGMMSLGLDMGVSVQVEADGMDEKEAINKISSYLSGKE